MRHAGTVLALFFAARQSSGGPQRCGHGSTLPRMEGQQQGHAGKQPHLLACTHAAASLMCHGSRPRPRSYSQRQATNSTAPCPPLGSLAAIQDEGGVPPAATSRSHAHLRLAAVPLRVHLVLVLRAVLLLRQGQLLHQLVRAEGGEALQRPLQRQGKPAGRQLAVAAAQTVRLTSWPSSNGSAGGTCRGIPRASSRACRACPPHTHTTPPTPPPHHHPHTHRHPSPPHRCARCASAHPPGRQALPGSRPHLIPVCRCQLAQHRDALVLGRAPQLRYRQVLDCARVGGGDDAQPTAQRAGQARPAQRKLGMACLHGLLAGCTAAATIAEQLRQRRDVLRPGTAPALRV